MYMEFVVNFVRMQPFGNSGLFFCGNVMMLDVCWLLYMGKMNPIVFFLMYMHADGWHSWTASNHSSYYLGGQRLLYYLCSFYSQSYCSLILSSHCLFFLVHTCISSIVLLCLLRRIASRSTLLLTLVLTLHCMIVLYDSGQIYFASYVSVAIAFVWFWPRQQYTNASRSIYYSVHYTNASAVVY